MLVFDKWTCNSNGRQAVFSREAHQGSERFARTLTARASRLASTAQSPSAEAEQADVPYKARMIDQGFCLNAGEWNYPDAPLRGLYARNRVWNRSAPGLPARKASASAPSQTSTVRFHRNGMKTMPMHCTGYWSNCTGAERGFRTSCWLPKIAAGSHFQIGDDTAIKRGALPTGRQTRSRNTAERPSAMNTVLISNTQRTFVHRIIRYTPSALRDEWINIGVLVFDPDTGDRGLRLIESEDEYRRVRRLIPHADEPELRSLRDDLESKLEGVGHGHNTAEELQKLLKTWEDSYTNGVHFAEPKGSAAQDLDDELERLYDQRVAVPRSRTRLPGSRATLRSYCAQVFRQAFGIASKSRCERRSSLFPVIRCAWTLRTGAMAREALCRPCP